MKIKGKKQLLWLIIPVVIIIAVVVIFVVNSTYDGDAYGRSNTLELNEKGSVVLHYNGADNMPETDTLEFTAFEETQLPQVTKEGYNFVGWVANGTYWGTSVTLSSAEEINAYAQFEKDYSDIHSAAALYSDDKTYKEYSLGEYADIETQAVDIFVNGGYKVQIFSESNFKGEETDFVFQKHFDDPIEIGSMKILKIESEPVRIDSITDDNKVELLRTYAPRIWWAEGEEYFASTIETAMENMSRVMTDNGYSYIIEDLDSPSYKCDYLYGSLTDCKCYAFATEKSGGYLDLSYYVFTPYNKAKEVVGFQFGNHIGDWEHVTVRLMKYEESSHTYYRPIIVDYSAHNFKNYASWDEVEKIDETHPIAYTALGSHGMWQKAGTHVYVNAFVVKLTDECSQGTAWDLWKNNSLETYCYDSLKHTGYGIGKSKWNSCFDFDYYNSDSNAVYSWGNRGWYSPIQIYPQLESGPRGPQHKTSMFNYYTLEG